MTSLYSHKTVFPTAADVAMHCLQLYFVLAGSQLLNLNRANKKGSSSKLSCFCFLLDSGGGGGGNRLVKGQYFHYLSANLAYNRVQQDFMLVLYWLLP